MFRKNELQKEIEMAIAADRSEDDLQAAKRACGLRFLVDARRDQTLADVRRVFAGFSERFETVPLFSSPTFIIPDTNEEVTWGETLFMATVHRVAFDDVGASPWDIAHALRAEGDFVRVIPEVPMPVPADAMPDDVASTASSAPLGWEHEAMRIKGAWAEIERRGRPPGTNVVIGHPDTGYVDHEVWLAGNLDTKSGKNFMPNETETDAKDPLNGPFPGHGNSTASVMVSPRGGKLVGVAPHSVVIPIRCVSTVVLYPFQHQVMQAVRYAMEKGCRVISLSLGGSSYPFLSAQLVHTAQSNVIVVAASGNSTFFTVEPASQDEVIGVGGTEYGDKEWKKSGWFPAGTVDISAPAADVFKAAYTGPGDYDFSEGTSYATAFMAGVAALWLSCHFPNGYRGSRYAYRCFREHVRRTARKTPGIGPGLFGLVDAEALMKTEPLPDAKAASDETSSDLTGAGAIARMLGVENADVVGDVLTPAIHGLSPALADAGPDVWADEIVLILNANPALRTELSERFDDGSITPDALRAAVMPLASNALRQRLSAAAT